MHISVSIWNILLHKRVIQAIHSVVSEGHNNLTSRKGLHYSWSP